MSYQIPKVGEELTVRVTGKDSQYGIYVATPTGYSGLIRPQNLSWSHQHKFFDALLVGEYTQAKVTGVRQDGKINFSRKDVFVKPNDIELGTILDGVVDSVEQYGLLIRFDAFIALAPWGELTSRVYKPGDSIKCVLIENIKDESGRVRLTVSVKPFHNNFAQHNEIGDRITARFVGYTPNTVPTAAISVNGHFLIDVSEKYFIEPFKTDLISKKLRPNEDLEFVYSKYNPNKQSIWLDMRPIEKERRRKQMDALRARLSPGDVVMGEVKFVDDKFARIEILDSGVDVVIPRDELSPNKILRASDEVFVGEHLKIVYTGDNQDGAMQFSRKYIVKDRYDDSLYSLSLIGLLKTMDIHTIRFVGKAISIKNGYFFTELMTVTGSNDEESGKLLIDPVNGKNILVRVDNRLWNLIQEGEFYEVSLELADTEYRKEEGTPYLFSISAPDLRKVDNPYRDAVEIAFKQHRSPNSNTGLANLLEEVGQGLYTSKKRMFFELLQNADDAAAKNGVKVKLQLNGQFFLLSHDGYSFNRHDFESITTAAKSTKSANKNKTGYKGIGFKSVFTNSNSVWIQSAGFRFSFDKNLDIYNDFDRFYFQVNKIENDQQRQAEFLDDFAKFKREFRGVKDIPWQLLPVWNESPDFETNGTIWNQRENVSIALRMSEETLMEYGKAIQEVFNEPRFMLFLRRTNRIQWIQDGTCLTIQKNISEHGDYISLVNSFKEEQNSENYRIFTKDDIVVNDDAFRKAGIMIKRKERTNNQGVVENYFVRIDDNGKELSEVPYIPDRIASATETSVSFAILLDDNGRVRTIDKEALSLYAYLPMNDHRFKFPFFVNADFIPKSDREGIQSENPWNYFLFYIIGQSIVSMVVENASIENPDYLNLLPARELESSGQDTNLLVDAFNRGYKNALTTSQFILNDQGSLSGISETIVDESSLAEYIGHAGYYGIVGTTKRLPNAQVESKTLSHTIFGIERTSVSDVVDIINKKPERILTWVTNATEENRRKFFEWLAKDSTTTPLISTVPTLKYGDTWISYANVANMEKYVITTEKLFPIVGILNKLGFVCSENILENHPLCDYLKQQEEKKLYSEIAASDISALDFQDRLALFNCAVAFDGVGEDTLAKWAVFKNVSGSFAPLNRLFAYNHTCPKWLEDYMILPEENHKSISRFLVKEENVYASIIEQYIDDILTKTDVLTVYNRYIQYWRQTFTSNLIKKDIPGIVSVIERSDDATKLSYIKSLRSLRLSSQSTYLKESLEYRIIKLAASNEQSIAAIRSVISVDGVNLNTINVKDQVSITYNGVPHSFLLTEIIPAYSSPVSLSALAAQFDSIEKANEIFAADEMSAAMAMNKIIQYFNKFNPGTRLAVTAKQFCFMMLYRKSIGYSSIGSQIGPHISLAGENTFKSVLDYCYSKGLGALLNEFLKDSYVLYPYNRTAGRYFDSDDYTLVSERAPYVITSWADTPEKKKFIIQLGFHDAESQEILRRKSFKQNTLENVWNITDSGIIKAFLEWVRSTFTLPITEANQVKILEGLFQTLGIRGEYVEQDFAEAKEWTNDQYLKWKKEKEYSIYVMDGEMPYRGNYNGSYLFKSSVGEFVYFSGSKRFYISSDREPEAVLADVYPQNNPFTKDDWNSIFLVSSSVVKEKDEIIAELQQKIDELYRIKRKDNDAEVEDHGKVTEKDNTDERSRYEINRDARIAAKEFLECLSDYDCSEWNPEEGRHIIKDTIKYKGKPITVAVLSSRSRKLYLHPRAFAELMEDPDNLLLNYGYDNKIHSLSFDDIFTDNPNVNLIFDTDIVSPKEIASLANAYMYSQNTCFVVENPKYSQSDVIKSFGLNEKKNDGSVMLGLSDEDIFNFGED
jgi:hypothetical protein